MEGLEALRAPFPPEKIGKLHMDGTFLEYVGHADVTDRLLLVDPEWNWEPLALDDRGLPVFDLGGDGKPIGLWIKLTVCGVTRLGYGSVTGNAWDPEKQLIGDAIRNAAMRFGVALDLWSKTREDDTTGDTSDRGLVDRPNRGPGRGNLPATSAQITFLTKLGGTPPEGITTAEASRLIDQLQDAKKKEGP